MCLKAIQLRLCSERVDFPKGEPENPFSEEEFSERYESLMAYADVSQDFYKSIYELTRNFDTKVSDLVKYL